MAYKCCFLDDTLYTAQDVNEIFSRITSGGVVFTDTGNTLSDLNETIGEMVTEGVSKDTDSCRVVCENGVYKIKKGACFMNDGSSIVFDDNGYELEITEDVENFVYLMRDRVANTISVVVSLYEGSEDTIPLARISRSGWIFDRRKYAKAKVQLVPGGAKENFTVNFNQKKDGKSETVTVDIGRGDFEHLILWGGTVDMPNVTYPRVATSRNLVPLKEGEIIYLAMGRYEGTQLEYICCEKDGQYLHIYLSNPTTGSEYALDMGVI